jgi:hypothetical protein
MLWFEVLQKNRQIYQVELRRAPGMRINEVNPRGLWSSCVAESFAVKIGEKLIAQSRVNREYYHHYQCDHNVTKKIMTLNHTGCHDTKRFSEANIRGSEFGIESSHIMDVPADAMADAL